VFPDGRYRGQIWSRKVSDLNFAAGKKEWGLKEGNAGALGVEEKIKGVFRIALAMHRWNGEAECMQLAGNFELRKEDIRGGRKGLKMAFDLGARER